MKIVVLAGGTSTERDVSIVSGTDICTALRSKGHQAILVDVFCGVENVDFTDPFPAEYDVQQASRYMKSFNSRIEEMKATRRSFFGPNVLALCELADFTFLGLHGANGEDGKLQATLDLMGIRYTGTDYLSSAIAMDKGVAKQFFRMHGVPTPNGIVMEKSQRTNDLNALGLSFPVVVKTACGGSSIGVYIVEDQPSFEDALNQGFSYEDTLVIEECIRGTEYTVAVVDGVAYPIVEIVPLERFYDYENKYKPGAVRETCPAPLSEEMTRKMQDYAVKGYHALGLQSYARLDFMMRDNGEMFCLEANTLPGMTPTSLIPQEAAVLGMDYPSLCEELIRISMKKYE
ncbi:MAG: D-alanine--D-alanine ligase [Clostridiales bacterium]|nr:D-alanine--D-alanine ligase [Candidatus Blautia equi]